MTVILKRRQRAYRPRELGPEIDSEAGAETSRTVEGDRMRRCATGRAERRGFNRIPRRDRGTGHVRKGRPGTWDGVSALLSTGQERKTAREIEPAGRREVGARSRSCDVGEPAPGDPAEQRSAPENRLAGGRR